MSRLRVAGLLAVGLVVVAVRCTTQPPEQDGARVEGSGSKASTAARQATLDLCSICLDIHLSDYNAFLLEDFTDILNVQGRVAAGGNITLSGFTVGAGQAEGALAHTLVAGGNLTLSNGAVHGDAWYGGSYSGTGVTYERGGAVAQGTPIDFAARFAELRSLSARLGAQPANGSTRLEVWGGLTMNGTDPCLNVFELNASTFGGVVRWDLEAPADSLVVVNIRGTPPAFRGFNLPDNPVNARRVLFNFVDATSLTIEGRRLTGTVLAPYARVTFRDGEWNGGLYAVSLGGGSALFSLSPLDEVGGSCDNNGEECSEDSQCTSGQCVDGVCCNSACAGECDACNLVGSEGTCSFMPPSVLCRAAGEVCGVAEYCTGSSNSCPADGQAPSGTACDDGNACTVGDVCDGAGSCAGTPGSCSPPDYGEWSPCGGFTDTCDMTGTQSRTVTSYSFDCTTSQCVATTTTETQACTRNTQGNTCGTPTYGIWGPCGGFSDTCDESGSQSRSVTSYACSNGSCAGSPSTETQACTIDTDGTACGTPTYGSWGPCEGFSDYCDTTGTQSRTVTTPSCATGACGSSSTSTETQACTRTVTSCAPPVYGPWSPCGGFSDTCDMTGTQSRTVTSYSLSCTTGQCVASTTTETQACTRNTQGNTCGSPTYGDWGPCGGFSSTCDESGSQSRSVTAYACSNGSCVGSPHSESRACTIDTDGDTCGTPTYGDWGPCGGFTDYCDTTGTQSRTVTNYSCATGACGSSTSPETQACTRTVTSCAPPVYGPWSPCGGFSDTCDMTGTQSRTVTSYSLNCTTGQCVASTTTETQACTRNTQGNTCGTPTYGSWGVCGGFSSTCDESGTQSRSVTAYACSNGSCAGSPSTETRACTIDTDGNTCGTPTYGSWGACGGFSDHCDTTGTQSRTVTNYSCATGACGSSSSTESRACTRTIAPCPSTSYGAWSPCGGFSDTCDMTGTQSRTVTSYSFNCATGQCVPTTTTETQACTRNTSGAACNDNNACTTSDVCNTSGTCSGTPMTCSGGKVCSSGSCVCPSGWEECSGVCRNLDWDESNCNSCGRRCDAHETCRMGVCECTYCLTEEPVSR